MTLHEVFQLLNDTQKLAEAESGEKPSEKVADKKYTDAAGHEELKRLARRKGIKVPTKSL